MLSRLRSPGIESVAIAWPPLIPVLTVEIKQFNN